MQLFLRREQSSVNIGHPLNDFIQNSLCVRRSYFETLKFCISVLQKAGNIENFWDTSVAWKKINLGLTIF